MSTPEGHDLRFSSKEYFELVESGLLDPDEQVELLEGLVVAKSPQNPAHAATIWFVATRLARLLDGRAIVRSQLPVISGTHSVPEPDIAVVPLRDDAWQSEHPDRCMLAVEISGRTLAQDRLTKSRIYAGAGIDDYWIVNLRARAVEWYSDPDPALRVYTKSGTASGRETLPPTVFGLALCANELFPPRTAATASETD